jgi:RNA polymerase sigma factor (sigma-70 family)
LQHEAEAKQFEAEIKTHGNLLYKVCRMYAFNDEDRQDLFQEIVLQCWRSYPTFKGNAKISTWLYRVALNTAIAGLRKKKNEVTKYPGEIITDTIADDTSWIAAEEQLQQMYRAIGKLSEVDKAIVMLYLDDRSYEEMEEILGIKEATLRVKMTRIKDRLRQLAKNE